MKVWISVDDIIIDSEEVVDPWWLVKIVKSITHFETHTMRMGEAYTKWRKAKLFTGDEKLFWEWGEMVRNAMGGVGSGLQEVREPVPPLLEVDARCLM